MAKDIRLLSGPLQTERLPDGRRRLLRALIFECEGFLIEVPEGMDTDYTSAPPIIRPFILWSKVDLAGVVHDYIYREGVTNRRHADRIWRQLAGFGKHSANPLQAWGGWALLRLFGHVAWNRYRRMPPQPTDTSHHLRAPWN